MDVNKIKFIAFNTKLYMYTQYITKVEINFYNF